MPGSWLPPGEAFIDRGQGRLLPERYSNGTVSAGLRGQPELATADLAAGRLGQPGDELDQPRVLVRRGALLDEVRQLAGQLGRRRPAGLEDDDRADHRAAVGVGDGDVRDGRMAGQHGLHLERPDACLLYTSDAADE